MPANQIERVILEAFENSVKKEDKPLTYAQRLKEETTKIVEALVTGDIDVVKALSQPDYKVLVRICTKHNKDFSRFKEKVQKQICDGVWKYFNEGGTEGAVAVSEDATSADDFKAKLKQYIDNECGGVLFSRNVDKLPF